MQIIQSSLLVNVWVPLSVSRNAVHGSLLAASARPQSFSAHANVALNIILVEAMRARKEHSSSGQFVQLNITPTIPNPSLIT